MGVPLSAGISSELRMILALPESAETTPIMSWARASEVKRNASTKNVRYRKVFRYGTGLKNMQFSGAASLNSKS